MTTATATIQFEIGQTYSCRSICDYNCIWVFTVIKRTAKFITLQDDRGKITRVGIRCNSESETAYPLGLYSMCPVISADDAGIKRPEWEMTA